MVDCFRKDTLPCRKVSRIGAHVEEIIDVGVVEQRKVPQNAPAGKVDRHFDVALVHGARKLIEKARIQHSIARHNAVGRLKVDIEAR